MKKNCFMGAATLLVLIISLLWFSCDKDEDSALVGIWKWQGDSNNPHDPGDCDKFLVFTSDGRGYRSECYNIETIFTWSVEGDAVTITAQDYVATFKFKVSGSKLYVYTEPADENYYEVYKLALNEDDIDIPPVRPEMKDETYYEKKSLYRKQRSTNTDELMTR